MTLCAKSTFCVDGGELKGTRAERRKWSRVKNAFLLHLGEELYSNVDSIVFFFVINSLDVDGPGACKMQDGHLK